MINRRKIRKYRRRPPSRSAPRRFIANGLKLISAVLLLWGLFHIIGGSGNAVHHPAKLNPPLVHEDIPPKALLERIAFAPPLNNLKKEIDVVSEYGPIRVRTSLEIGLQEHLQAQLDRDTARYIAIVVMNPGSGRILAMVGFDKEQPQNYQVCTAGVFPAASVFKIVTAGAAIEKCGFEPETLICYNGGKYTLYRSQLKNTTPKNSHCLSLQDSFAQSINPVFGKIGIHHLGKELLEKYGGAFGFNRQFNFETPIRQSVLEIEDNTYNWAEIASGFNRDTMISPLHGAMIAGAIINKGWMVEPTLVDSIRNEQGQIIYKSPSGRLKRALTGEAAAMVERMMAETVKTGTFRKTFRGIELDPVLAPLLIGAKSGSISSRAQPGVKYDWFVGFAAEKNGFPKIALSVLVAHDQYIGTRAAWYARNAIRYYFSTVREHAGS